MYSLNNLHSIYKMYTTDSYTILEVLNVDCWNHIFSYVSTRDLLRSERVSKKWRNVVTVYFGRNRRRSFDTICYPQLTIGNELVRIFTRIGAAYTRLYIDQLFNNTKIDMGLYSQVHFDSDICPNLEYLEINAQGSRSDYWLFFLSKKLKELYLKANNFDIADQLFIKKCNNDFSLESITLKNDLSTGKFLADNINKFQNITYLAFQDCHNLLKINYLKSINQLPKLTTLKMDGCSFHVLQIILNILGSLRQLEVVSLSEYFLSNSSYYIINTVAQLATEIQLCEALSKLSALVFLELRNNKYVTNNVMKQIAQSCKLLECLDVIYCSVDSEGVTEVLRSCVNLQVLHYKPEVLTT